MKNLLIILLLMVVSSSAKAQNLVPNYSFEVADSCPVYLNDRTYMYSLGCIGWGQATAGTTDYFNSCDTEAISIGRLFPWVGVPYNNFGFQEAYEGHSYCGLNIYAPSLPYYKEYLICKTPKLEVDSPYRVTIHISLADLSKYATDGFGVLFTTYGSPVLYHDTTITKSPQIDYTSYGIISDKFNWTTLSEVFIADSEYTYLIIGGFKRAIDMNIQVIYDTSITLYNHAYYYIDNIIVEKLSSTTVPSLLTNDKEGIYPNPFTNHANLVFNNHNSEDCSVRIYNLQGQLVHCIENITSSVVRIEKGNLPAGVYFYYLQDGHNNKTHGRFTIY